MNINTHVQYFNLNLKIIIFILFLNYIFKTFKIQKNMIY